MKENSMMNYDEYKERYRFRLIWLLIPFLFIHMNVNAQNIRQIGVIVDQNGDPMIGVTIIVKGTTVGVVSDLNGSFSIDCPKEAVLQFSYMGFDDIEQKASGQKMNITMSENSRMLEEVVVIPYGGVTTKKHLTSAGTALSADVIERKSGVSIFDALQGAAPGLQITATSGAPGQTSFVTMRGASTFSDSGVSPLFVVDGVITDNINNIAPEDIARVDVMRDAATAAIYGARAANGVILITTKSGEIGKSRVSGRYQRSYYSVANKLPQVNAFESRLSMNGTQLADPATTLEKFSSRTDSVGLQYSTNYYYQDLLFRTAARDEGNIQVSGGSNSFKYRASLNYTGEQGVILTAYNNRYTANINTDFVPWKDVTVFTRIRLSNQKRNSIRETVMQDAMRRDPDMIIWYPDGELIPYYESGGRRNPIAELTQRTNETTSLNGTFYQGFSWQIKPWLKLDANVSATYSSSDNVQFVSKYLQGTEGAANTGSNSTDKNLKYSGESYLNFSKNFFSVHSLNAMLGASFENQFQKGYQIGGSEYISEEMLYMNMATIKDLSNVYTTGWEESMASFFGRVMYSLKDRYILTGLLRLDGSSRFGSNNRWGVFPSVSGAWRFSDEQFMKPVNNILNDGKLRVSYGVTGNDKIGRYESRTTYTTGSYYYNGIGGVVPNSKYGNPSLKWEETKQTNFGTDLIFLNGRVSLSADYYIKKTSDLLSDMNLPYTTGYNNIRVNLASIENRGLELSLTATPVRIKNFSWQTTVNWWKNKNKITDLAREDYVSNSTWLVAKGESAGIWYGYKNLGVYAYDANNAYTSDYSQLLTPVFKRDDMNNVIIGLNGKPTLLKYLLPDGTEYTGDVKQMMINGVIASGGDIIWHNKPDENGVYDGVIDSNDRIKLGNANPNWYASWVNNLNYKNFTLSFNFYMSWGGLIYNDLKRYYCSWGGNTHKQHPEYILSGWKYQGEITNWYAIDSRARSTNNYSTVLNSQFLEDASFIRLASSRIGYNVEKKWMRKTPFNSSIVYVYGNNLLTWTNYSGFDPEIGGSVLNPGKDDSKYPKSREIGFGINIEF